MEEELHMNSVWIKQGLAHLTAIIWDETEEEHVLSCEQKQYNCG